MASLTVYTSEPGFLFVIMISVGGRAVYAPQSPGTIGQKSPVDEVCTARDGWLSGRSLLEALFLAIGEYIGNITCPYPVLQLYPECRIVQIAV